MSEKTTWIIGADPSCDLVVDVPSVSRRHCRLGRGTGGTFTVVDLGSTNGTFVNGHRVSSEVVVRRGDAVTLGYTVPMPWPEVTEAADPAPTVGRVIRVGREPDNDRVIESPEVSGHHARVVIAPGGRDGFVEDLGSTNGTSVGTPGQRVTRALIAPGDLIYFGPVAVPAASFFGEDEGAARPVAASPPVAAAEASIAPYAMLAGLVLGVQAIALAVLVLVLRGWSTAAELFALGMSALWVGVSAAFFEGLLALLDPDDRSSAGATVGGLARSQGRAAGVTVLPALLLMCLVPRTIPGAGNWPAACAVVGLTALVGAALGLAVVRASGRLAWGVPIVAVLCLVLGALSAPTGTAAGRGKVARLAASAAPTRWSFEALRLLAAGAKADDPATDPVAADFPAETDRSGLLACATALLAMLGGLVYADAVMALTAAGRPPRDGPASR